MMARTGKSHPLSLAMIPGLLVTLMSWPVQATDAPWTFVGKAYDADSSDRLIYEERHTVHGHCAEDIWLPTTHEVLYFRPQATEAFASKTLDYEQSVLRPSYDFKQPDFGERMVVTNQQDHYLTIEWHTKDGDLETFRTDINESVVVDAGFDNQVRMRWGQINDGQTIDFRFLGPTRGKHYAFVLEQAAPDSVDADVALQIRPSGMITRFLVDTITLGYNDRGFLTDYVGLTNVRKNRDVNYTAHIRYGQTSPPNCSLVPKPASP